jgi:hypothetical protein
MIKRNLTERQKDKLNVCPKHCPTIKKAAATADEL